MAMIAGSIDALLSDDDTRLVFEAFEEGCRSHYGIEIRSKRSLFNARTLRQVKSFAKEFGAVDGVRIIRRLFAEPYNGKANGKVIGASIFSQGFRWLANQLLLESDIGKDGDMDWKKF